LQNNLSADEQVGDLQAIAPGAKSRLQESDRGVEALPESMDEIGFLACPAADEAQGPALGLLEALGFIYSPEVAPQPRALEPAPFLQPRDEAAQSVS